MKQVIDSIDDDGRGRGRAGRRTVLVSQGYPGEIVTVRVDKRSANTLQGRAVNVLQAHAQRLASPCRHEFRCTGCPMLGLSAQEEGRFKAAKLQRLLAPLGPDVAHAVTPFVRPTDLYGYRHYSKQVFFTGQGGVINLGSYVQGTHEGVDNTGCSVLAPPLAAFMEDVVRVARRLGLEAATPAKPGLRYAIARQSRHYGTLMLVISTSDQNARLAIALVDALRERHPQVVCAAVLRNDQSNNSVLFGDLVYRVGEQGITERLLGVDHVIGPTSFFQINPVAAEAMMSLAAQMAGEGGVCVEGYAGVGALTFELGRRFARVAAFESNPAAVAALNATAARLGMRHVHGVATRAEEGVALALREGATDAVVLDPPRKGIGVDLAMAIAAAKVPRVVVLSCEPTSLLRDLPGFLERGYRLQRLVPIDQFPRTAHFETVSLLTC